MVSPFDSKSVRMPSQFGHCAFSLHSGEGTQCKVKGFPSTGLCRPWMTWKDMTMFKLTRFPALALVAAMALPVTAAPQTAQAQPAAAKSQVSASDTTDISARRYARRGYRNNAAGAAFAGLHSKGIMFSPTFGVAVSTGMQRGSGAVGFTDLHGSVVPTTCPSQENPTGAKSVAIKNSAAANSSERFCFC